MRILQLLCFPIYGSGSGMYVRNLCLALARQGHTVGIACPDNRKLNNIQIFTIKLPFMAVFTGHPEHPNAKLYSQLTGTQLNDIQSAFMSKILKAVESFKPDIIHVHHASNLSWIANYIKAVFQIHYIITSHNTDIMNAILDKRYIPLTQDALNRADFITAVSFNTKERLIKTLGKGCPKLRSKMRVVPCGVDTQSFPAEGSFKKVEDTYNRSHKKVILYCGKITTIKGIDLFVRAATHFPNAQFIVVGDGEEMPSIKKIIKEENISNVLLAGYLGSKNNRTISQFYRMADIVVLPSTISEGIPLTLLEAMSSKTAVIGSNIGGIPTAIRHMKNGVLIKPASQKSLNMAIKILLEDDSLREKLAFQARNDAVRKFDWEIIVQQMEKYYQITHQRSIKNKASKKPSYITEKEYQDTKKTAAKKNKI